jgi:hypothetical protein
MCWTERDTQTAGADTLILNTRQITNNVTAEHNRTAGRAIALLGLPVRLARLVFTGCSPHILVGGTPTPYTRTDEYLVTTLIEPAPRTPDGPERPGVCAGLLGVPKTEKLVGDRRFL